MRWITVMLVAGLGGGLAIPVAVAAEQTPGGGGPAADASAGPQRLSHRHQASLGLLVGSGYRGLVRYEETDSCGDPGKAFCTSRLPTFIELQAAYGVTDRLSPILDLRVGVEEDFTHGYPLGLAPGIKYYIDPDDRLKFFATLQIPIDFTSQEPGVPRVDVGLRNANGVQLDLNRHLGLWVQLGETIGFRRFFRFELDLAVGVEGRLP